MLDFAQAKVNCCVSGQAVDSLDHSERQNECMLDAGSTPARSTRSALESSCINGLPERDAPPQISNIFLGFSVVL